MSLVASRLQNIAVFDDQILTEEKPQTVRVGVQNSYQEWIMTEPRHKVTKYELKTMKIKAWVQTEVQNL